MHSNTLLINRFGQGKIDVEYVIDYALSLQSASKVLFEKELYDLIHQSRCNEQDIILAAQNAAIKLTSSICVVARKGLFYANVMKILALPDKRSNLKFLLNLFKIGYQRRMGQNTDLSKWWYQDL